MNDRLLTTREAAGVLGVSPGTLQNWRWRGEGPPIVKVGAQAVRYAEADLQAFVDSHRIRMPRRQRRRRPGNAG